MGPRFGLWRDRVLWLAGMAFVVALVLLSIAAPASYVFVHETAESEFCNSCHIMEPFYASWQASAHSDVACIECHYEPGVVETFEGKFQALSQLAKYVTRTQGTKPWAEVADTSCLRSGCHSVRLLDGPLAFGEVNFDHAPHLFDPRPGLQLRCVTCHAQIVQSEHISVSADVCFSCHFMPDEHGELSPRNADCDLCHGPPEDPVEVAGLPFEHVEYVARGVECRECHDPVVEGRGTVRIERCKSCHADPEMIARADEAAFLHEAHVEASKVECFECHDQIHHGLLSAEEHAAGASDCASCHGSSHDAARLVYAGRGASAVEDAPSRMHQTRVLCQSCHTGRSGRMEASAGTTAAHGEAVGAAGNVDCLHCHGHTYDGMLASWQATVSSELERLRPALERAEARADPDLDGAGREALAAVRADLELLERDGSLGAHNIDYTLDVLRSVAERIDGTAGAPFRSAHGCSTCHMGVEAASATLADGRSFSHAAHLAGGALDCDACHSLEQHGQPSFPRSDCAGCHHSEERVADPFDCAACHAAQEGLLRGTLVGTDPERAVMGEMECSECHGEPPDVLSPSPALCVLCHEAGYDAMQADWQRTVGGELERLERALAAAERGGAEPARCTAARASLVALASDGSLGAHNVAGALDLLRAAAEHIDAARGPGEPDSATAGLPFRSEHGCSTCHLGAESAASTMADGRLFRHATHVVPAGLDCDACHSVEEHGEPAFERSDCASCHHRETGELDPLDCARCHADQRAFFEGAPAGLAAHAPAMPDKGCTECHGEPPDIVQPSGALCVLCHEDGYDEQLERWRATTDALAAELETELEAAAGRGAPAGALERARAALDAVRGDGSRGVHNAALAEALLRGGLDALRE